MQNKKLNTLVKISVLSTAAFILMLIEIPLPIFPEFLKIDISDLPAILGSFAMGPVAGVIIEAIKNILHFIIKNGSAGIGEAANFVVGGAFVYTAGIIYRRRKNRTHALYGLLAGTAAMVAAGAVGNYYVFMPLYEKVLGFPIAAMVEAAKAINPAVTDFNYFIALSIVPFNLLKAVAVSAIAFLIYKRLSPVLHK
jgi:riboflavin transporter FmnP